MIEIERFHNYIFDLYGTLVDIHTDEEPAAFWRWLAERYRTIGAVYEPEALKKRYRELVTEGERRLKKETGCTFPEIRLDDVFRDLIDDGSQQSRRPFARGSAGETAWIEETAAEFRERSRDRLAVYPGALELLNILRAKGKRVYLLSNAQAVFTRPELDLCGLADAFDDIFLSSDRGVKKPEPRFLGDLMAAHRMEPDETVLIGNDWTSDMAVAAANGIHAIHINSDGWYTGEKNAFRTELECRFGYEAVSRIREAESLAELLASA